jgi:prolipoprotein diacylglyceryltransferase
MQKIFQREQIPQKTLDRLSIYMLIGTVVGARLGHCFFYEPAYYISHPFEIQTYAKAAWQVMVLL